MCGSFLLYEKIKALQKGTPNAVLDIALANM